MDKKIAHRVVFDTNVLISRNDLAGQFSDDLTGASLPFPLQTGLGEASRWLPYYLLT